MQQAVNTDVFAGLESFQEVAPEAFESHDATVSFVDDLDPSRRKMAVMSLVRLVASASGPGSA